MEARSGAFYSDANCLLAPTPGFLLFYKADYQEPEMMIINFAFQIIPDWLVKLPTDLGRAEVRQAELSFLEGLEGQKDHGKESETGTREKKRESCHGLL